jgi:group II intron reverse transcriptase/maturase
VRENHGCAGVDGVTVEAFAKKLGENCAKLLHEIDSGEYRPWPLRKIIFERTDGKIRTLLVPAVRDRVAQSAIVEILNPRFEAEFENCSFGYRHGLSVRSAVDEIIRCRDQGFTKVVDADIDSYFDEIDQKMMFHKVENILWKKNAPGPPLSNPNLFLDLIKKWIKAEVWDGLTINRLDKGIPQGATISPMLANLFLDELDEALLASDRKLIRYADDFLVLCKSDSAAQNALDLTDRVLEKMHLRLSDEKTKLTDFDQGFKFLGVIFVRSMVMLPYEHPKRIAKTLSIAPALPPELAKQYLYKHALAQSPATVQAEGLLRVTLAELVQNNSREPD